MTTQMVRKQFYIHKRQDALLKRLPGRVCQQARSSARLSSEVAENARLPTTFVECNR
jgi:hypothetical protein